MADFETSQERPKCGYNTTADPSKAPTPCGSEKDLHRFTVRETSSVSGGVVCGEHRIKVWTHHDVERIEPLDRTVK